MRITFFHSVFFSHYTCDYMIVFFFGLLLQVDCSRSESIESVSIVSTDGFGTVDSKQNLIEPSKGMFHRFNFEIQTK